MKRIPEGTLLRQNNYGDSYGDIIESFNLDLNSNFGAVRTTRMKRVVGSTDTGISAGNADIEIPVGITFYNDKYWFITDDFAYQGGASPSDTFTKDTSTNAPSGEPIEALSDIELFNGSMYVSGSTQIMKLNVSTWSTPVTTQLTAARPHLLKAYGTGDNSRLYVTDEYYKVHSVSTADAISATGSYTMDLKLDNNWTITMLEAAEDALWIGLLNTEDGRGLMFEWDGVTENVYNRRFELQTGVVAGVVMDNVPYYVDVRGRLFRYNGSSFTEVERLPISTQYLLRNANDGTNLRFIHPNGMAVTDQNTILIALTNEINNQQGYNDNSPSGVYEYHPEFGLSHKYSLSSSPAGATIYTDYGMHRIAEMGAIFYRRPPVASTTKNGILLVGAEVILEGTTNEFAIFCDDTLDTTPKLGYMTTKWIWSDNVQDIWQKIYPIYRVFQNATDKIVVKYRTIEKNSVSATCFWTSNTTFTTTGDLSDIEVGDEVTILNGTGAGQPMRITNIEASATVYTVTVAENALNASTDFMGRFENFKELISVVNSKEHSAITIPNATSSSIQFKVYMYFTGKQELHKLHVVNKTNIKE